MGYKICKLGIQLKSHLDRHIIGYESHKLDLIKLFKPLKVSRRSYILSRGEVWGDFYFIGKGLFRLIYTTECGKEFNKVFFVDGQLMGPIAPIIQNTESNFDIQALESGELLYVSAKRFRQLLKGSIFGEIIQRHLVEELVDLKIQREAEFLLDSATIRYTNFVKNNPALNQRLSNTHIASYIGISEVSLSRIRKTILLT